jgi:hypothetical protein
VSQGINDARFAGIGGTDEDNLGGSLSFDMVVGVGSAGAMFPVAAVYLLFKFGDFGLEFSLEFIGAFMFGHHRQQLFG